jgi:hypothetical protein
VHSRPGCPSPSPKVTQDGTEETIRAVPVIFEHFKPADASRFDVRGPRHLPDSHTVTFHFTRKQIDTGGRSRDKRRPATGDGFPFNASIQFHRRTLT